MDNDIQSDVGHIVHTTDFVMRHIVLADTGASLKSGTLFRLKLGRDSDQLRIYWRIPTI